MFANSKIASQRNYLITLDPPEGEDPSYLYYPNEVAEQVVRKYPGNSIWQYKDKHDNIWKDFPAIHYPEIELGYKEWKKTRTKLAQFDSPPPVKSPTPSQSGDTSKR